MRKRTGVTVPLSALYTKECAGCGDFLALETFVDFCEKVGFDLVQLLPVNDTGTQSSPYSGLSAFALHPMYIRIRALPEFNDCFANDKSFAKAYKAFEKKYTYSPRFNYGEITSDKNWLLHLMYNYIERKIAAGATVASEKKDADGNTVPTQITLEAKINYELEHFINSNSWVIPYAVFKNIKDENLQASWKSWDEGFRNVTASDIQLRWSNKAKKNSHKFFIWCQLRAAEQFKQAADYARSKGVAIKGDLPILLNEDSVDCWSHGEFFRQDLRAGSPPDGDNPMGQNWGFPTYDWERMEADGYEWWKSRIRCASQYYDAFRIDHVLGFFRIWATPETDTTAFLGHTNPYSSIPRADLNDAGFEDDRIKWLAYPHIPTGIIENITWNHDEAVACLEKVCDRIGTQELWLFKDEIKGDKQFYEMKFFDEESKNLSVQNALAQKWRDRSLIEIKKNEFIPVYDYGKSTSWGTLSWEEQQKLNELFEANKEKEEKLWKKQAESTLSAIVHASDMVACAEDLGVNLKVMPDVLKKLEILSLKVVRWNRKWAEENQPYFEFDEYPELSVTTTSVHDSSTLRQWWNQEKESVQSFLKMAGLDETLDYKSAFTSEIAERVLRTVASTKSAYFVNPLQDYLFVEHSLYLEKEDDERINIPGSVSEFNWTYRIPDSVENLMENKSLINKIKGIVALHKNDGEDENR